jgi:hypothetical protein
MDLLNQLSIARAVSLFPRTKLEANCLSTDFVGHCVYITGPVAGELYQVTTADPLDGATKMPSLGIIISKSSPTQCVVQVAGEMNGVVTGLTPNKVVFVSSAGVLTHVPPTPPVGVLAYIQSMGIATSTDRVLVQPDFSIIKRLG